MKQNNIISVLSLILAISIGYNFYLLSNSESRKDILALQKDCQSVGEKLFKEDTKDLSKTSVMFNPIYGYNNELNTCLYYGGYMDSNSAIIYTFKWIKDSYTNKEILSYNGTNESSVDLTYCGDSCVATLEEFEQRKKELLGQ